MKKSFFVFFFIPFVIYSQSDIDTLKMPGGISTGPTNPPSAPPISYVIDIYFLNTITFLNSLVFTSSSIKDNLDSHAYRREILIYC